MTTAIVRGASRSANALRLRGGAAVTVRPAGPGDDDVIQSYIRGLSPSSRRDRFLGALNELSAVELYRMTHSQPGSELALIVETVADGARIVIGEARCVPADDGLSAEIALSVAEAWRRKTLGTQLIGILVRQARTLGVDHLVATVLHSNEAVKALARKMGFGVAAPVADARLLQLFTNISLADGEQRWAGLRLN